MSIHEDGELKLSVAASPFHPWNESSEAEIFGISTKLRHLELGEKILQLNSKLIKTVQERTHINCKIY